MSPTGESFGVKSNHALPSQSFANSSLLSLELKDNWSYMLEGMSISLHSSPDSSPRPTREDVSASVRRRLLVDLTLFLRYMGTNHVNEVLLFFF